MSPLISGEAADLLNLIQQALLASGVPVAVKPTLRHMVEHCAAERAAYLRRQGGPLRDHARAPSGVMPCGAAMNAILAHGLSAS